MTGSKSKTRLVAVPDGHGPIGGRIRRERADRGLSLRELARRLDVSPSLVSQIETGKIQPSVRTLYAMVSELGISLDELFGNETLVRSPANRAPAEPTTPEPVIVTSGDGDHVQRLASRPVIELETRVRWERLTVRSEPGTEFLLAVYPPGAESASADALIRHTGCEFGFILKGELGVTVGFDEYTLYPGDSVFFDSTNPHRLHNDGTETVEAVWVVLGR